MLDCYLLQDLLSQGFRKSEDDSDSRHEVDDDDGSYVDEVSSQSQMSEHISSRNLAKKRRNFRKAKDTNLIQGVFDRTSFSQMRFS